jgi:hypothetical protein
MEDVEIERDADPRRCRGSPGVDRVLGKVVISESDNRRWREEAMGEAIREVGERGETELWARSGDGLFLKV